MNSAIAPDGTRVAEPGSPEQPELRPGAEHAAPPPEWMPPRTTVEQVGRHRGFGRAPPRVDRRVLERACIVLLI